MNKKIFLTFDDGPNQPYTGQILDVLKEYRVKATFFVCGAALEKDQNTALRIVQEGHAIGNHTYSHTIWRVITGLVRSEILKTNLLIKKQTGVTVTLYRSPWGITVPWLRPWIKKQGMHIWHWDSMAYDWRTLKSSDIATRVITTAQNNTVVLLHDGYNGLGADRSQTVGALPEIIKNLQIEGYEFLSLEEFPKNKLNT